MSTRAQLLTYIFLSLVVTAAQAQFPSVEIKVKYVCRSDGRYWTAYNRGEKHYCWEGKHYSQSTGGVPQFVLDYWTQRAQESAQIREEMKRVREDLAARVPANRAAVGRQAGYRTAAMTVAGATTVEQSQKPIQKPLALELFNGLDPGAERGAIIAKLGEPHGSVTNLGSDGDEESLTYLVENGGNASVRLKQGKLLAIRLPHP